jgi:ribosomal protein S1
MQYDVANYEAFATDHAVGSPVRGRVRAVAQFGVFVELAPNVQGLMEIWDFPAGPPKRFPQDFPQVGTLIQVRIKYFDIPTMNIRLTQRSPRMQEGGGKEP